MACHRTDAHFIDASGKRLRFRVFQIVEFGFGFVPNREIAGQPVEIIRKGSLPDDVCLSNIRANASPEECEIIRLVFMAIVSDRNVEPVFCIDGMRPRR